jgi:hypothetical protein
MARIVSHGIWFDIHDEPHHQQAQKAATWGASHQVSKATIQSANTPGTG